MVQPGERGYEPGKEMGVAHPKGNLGVVYSEHGLPRGTVEVSYLEGTGHCLCIHGNKTTKIEKMERKKNPGMLWERNGHNHPLKKGVWPSQQKRGCGQ